jgi:hypothetical protein
MATTTNYGWTTPDDTALVKDGASAIRTLGTSVDTTTKNLNPETTLGDVSFRSSTSNVNTRLGIGTTGQVLTVAGGVPSWSTISAGGMTSIASGSLPTGATSVTLSSIVGTYTDLTLYIRGFYMSPTAYRLSLRVNGDTGSNYFGVVARNATLSGLPNNTQFNVFENSDMGTTATQSFYGITFFDYASTLHEKVAAGNGYLRNTDATRTTAFGTFSYTSASAITSITILSEGQAANFSGGTYELFGVK